MSATPTVDDMMSAYAEDAVDYADSKFGIALDYSQASVEQVERILEQLYAEMPRGLLARLRKPVPSADTIDQICKMLGGYVGEVFRRLRGGEWWFDREVVPGSLTISLRIGDVRIYPPAKV